MCNFGASVWHSKDVEETLEHKPDGELLLRGGTASLLNGMKGGKEE